MINFACILESSLWHHWWHLLRIGTIGVERSWLQNGPWGINSYKVLPVPKRNSKLSSSCIAKDGKEATQQSKCAQLLWLGTHLSQCWSLALQASSCWLQIEHWDLWGKPGAFWQVSWEILGTWSIWEKLIGGLVLVHKVGSSRGCSECHHSDSNSDVGVWQGSKSWKLQVLQTASPHNCLTSGPSARPPFWDHAITAASRFLQVLLCRSRVRWMLWPSARRIVHEQMGESSNMRQLLHCMIIFVSSNECVIKFHVRVTPEISNPSDERGRATCGVEYLTGYFGCGLDRCILFLKGKTTRLGDKTIKLKFHWLMMCKFWSSCRIIRQEASVLAHLLTLRVSEVEGGGCGSMKLGWSYGKK